MKIHSTTVDHLSSGELAAWDTIQRDNPLLHSPYFRPEFSQAVAAVRGNAEVAVIKKDGCPLAFFPYQRTLWNSGRPMGGQLSDFHAAIASPGVRFDPVALVRECGLRSWRFSQLVLSEQGMFAPFVWREAEAPYVDLSRGFASYVADRENGHRMLARYRQKKRKLEREIGPVRYVPRVKDPAVLATCIQWKAEQYRRTKIFNIFDWPWVVNLLETILECDSPGFASMLSVTYAGDEIAAINFGMRSGDVLHPWFPVYNTELAQYSPGVMHWIETMQAADNQGVRRIDLGKGSERYKRQLMSGTTRVVEGGVYRRASLGVIRRSLSNLRRRARSSTLCAPARRPMRALFRIRQKLEMS